MKIPKYPNTQIPKSLANASLPSLPSVMVLTLISFLLSTFCFCLSAHAQAKKFSDYPNRPYVTNGSWLMLLAETGVTNYNQTWNQHTNQLWQRILGGTNYGVFTFIGGVGYTNVVLSPSSFQTNYTLSVTNSAEQEIVTGNTNVNMTIAADRTHAPATLWLNALASSINATSTWPASCRTNIGFVSTVTNGTARSYSVEFRGGLAATNLWIISNDSAIQ